MGGIAGNFSVNTVLQATSSYAMGGAIQGTALNIATVVSTLTGTAPEFDPYGITTDGTSLYIADWRNNKISKIVIATGAVTTLAGSGLQGSTDDTGTAASFYRPSGITTDGINLYVTDSYNHNIRKIVIATGVVTTLAGSGSKGEGEGDGTGTAASFRYPMGITTDGTNLYIADTENFTIRKVVIATGAVTTLAGGILAGYTDGKGMAAGFFLPLGITTDGTNLYIADTVNNTIRKMVIATNVVTTLAGSKSAGNVDGTGAEARFSNPIGITCDGINLYVTDAGLPILSAKSY